MDRIDKKILTAIYVSSLTNENVISIIRKKFPANSDHIKSRIDSLVKNGLVESNEKTLTGIGRSSLRVVLAGGVFDIIHPGHIHTLKAAKKLGDVLVVVVATDKTAEKMKKRKPLHDMQLRCELVGALSIVDCSVIGQEGDIFKTVDAVKPEIIALGYDQVHQEKFITDGCKKLNLEVQIARLQSPIPDIKSSKIEEAYGESIHGI